MCHLRSLPIDVYKRQVNKRRALEPDLSGAASNVTAPSSTLAPTPQKEMKETDFTNCGMKMQVPEEARIYDSTGRCV